MRVGAEVDEELVDLVEDLGRAGVGAVDLVDRDDDRQVAGHRLLEDVAGLGQRALGGVDQEQDRVDHQERALDLAAEVGVAGRVDDVQPDAVVVDRRLLGEDRDPLLALEVARVHDPVDDGLVRPEGAGLAEHRVDEGRLAVVDVGDDGDVAEVACAVARGRGRGGQGRRVMGGGSACRRPWPRLNGGLPPWPHRALLAIRTPMTVAAVILAASPESALADADGMRRGPADRRRRPGRAARRRSSSSSFDPDGAVAAALAGSP